MPATRGSRRSPTKIRPEDDPSASTRFAMAPQPLSGR